MLLAPAVVMGLVARSDSDALGVVLVLGGGASAVFCGVWLVRRLFAEHGITLQVFMSVAFTAILFAVNAVLCCVGCTLGGGEFNIH